MTLFISHCTADDAFVDRLAVELQLQGHQTWVDHTDMPPGTRWVSQLEKALESSDVMLLVLSEKSVASTYVQSEWHAFFDLKRPIYPIRLDSVGSPLFLRTYHHLDFRNPDKFYDQFNLLLSVLPRVEGDTMAVSPLEDVTHTNKAQVVDDEWQEYVNVIRKASHQLIQQYARPLQANEIQVVMPAAEDLLHYSIGSSLIIGRHHEASDYCPDVDLHEFPASNKVSRKHAELRRGRRGLEIIDLGSTNGTYLGRELLEPGVPYRVPNNALISLGADFPIVIRYQL
jgi:hypothetical protein